MSKSPKRNYKKEAKELKRLGLVNYDLRFNLTPAQKSSITKHLKKYGEIVRHPEQFVTRKVSRSSAIDLQKAGFLRLPKSDKIIIPHKKGDGKITVKKGRLQKWVQRGSNKVWTKETVIPLGGRNFNKTIASLQRRKLKPGEFLTVSFGSNNAISMRFDSFASLQRYVNNDMKINGDRDKAIQHLNIVRVFDPQFLPDDMDEDYGEEE